MRDAAVSGQVIDIGAGRLAPLRLAPMGARPRTAIQVAAAFGISRADLQTFQRSGLIPSLRTSLADARAYSAFARRLRVIVLLWQAGLDLVSIDQVLTLGEGDAYGAQADFTLAALADRQQAIERQLATLRLVRNVVQSAEQAGQTLGHWLSGSQSRPSGGQRARR